MTKFCVVGGGWYGCHIALVLSKAGHDVVLYERESDIFKGISGTFGIRIHTGLHYPRSEQTRKNCRAAFQEFIEMYPQLVVKHEYSIYGVGSTDADNQPSRVTLEKFAEVCQEIPGTQAIDVSSMHYDTNNVLGAWSVYEPSIKLGEPLRKFFKDALCAANIPVIVNCEVTKITMPHGSQQVIVHSYQQCTHREDSFDYVINATGYKSLLSEQEFIIYRVAELPQQLSELNDQYKNIYLWLNKKKESQLFYMNNQGMPQHIPLQNISGFSEWINNVLHNNNSCSIMQKQLNEAIQQYGGTILYTHPLYDLEVVYQACIALVYKDRIEKIDPFSWIIIDGWFPCVMPLCDRDVGPQRYIVTHGKWAILGSYKDSNDAYNILNTLTDPIIESIKARIEAQIERFWPDFKHRMQYESYKTEVLMKVVSTNEFRSALTWMEEKQHMICLMPGKVTDVINTAREVLQYINAPANIMQHHGYQYIKGGSLDRALIELTNKPKTATEKAQNTCHLQTYNLLLQELMPPANIARSLSENALKHLRVQLPPIIGLTSTTASESSESSTHKNQQPLSPRAKQGFFKLKNQCKTIQRRNSLPVEINITADRVPTQNY